MRLKIGAALAAANGAPSGATAGFPLAKGAPGQVVGSNGEAQGFSAVELITDKLDVLVKSTAGSGTMTATVAIWAYHSVVATWVCLGTLYNGAAIPEQSADNIAYSEQISGLAPFSRAYAELVAVGGTSTAVDVWLVAR